MENQNPIKTKDTIECPDFFISKVFQNKKMYLTTKTELLSEGWKLHLIHGLSLNGKPQDFDPTPDIVRKCIGKCKDLEGFQFYLTTKASRMRDGGDDNVPKVKYTLRFEAGDELIDKEFTLTSTDKNPVTFYTYITLKIVEEL
ncbi:MAG: hypothetical protein IPH58_16055 [Sphingobacteriales bacterium]|jgi:hypothetical protein|nr:hypothetical protein [Sphingobacteriales bacterium]